MGWWLGGWCYVNGCNVDHRHDETPYTEWEEPQPDRLYTIAWMSVRGFGQDYSVIFVNKMGGPLAAGRAGGPWRETTPSQKNWLFIATSLASGTAKR